MNFNFRSYLPILIVQLFIILITPISTPIQADPSPEQIDELAAAYFRVTRAIAVPGAKDFFINNQWLRAHAAAYTTRETDEWAFYGIIGSPSTSQPNFRSISQVAYVLKTDPTQIRVPYATVGNPSRFDQIIVGTLSEYANLRLENRLVWIETAGDHVNRVWGERVRPGGSVPGYNRPKYPHILEARDAYNIYLRDVLGVNNNALRDPTLRTDLSDLGIHEIVAEGVETKFKKSMLTNLSAKTAVEVTPAAAKNVRRIELLGWDDYRVFVEYYRLYAQLPPAWGLDQAPAWCSVVEP